MGIKTEDFCKNIPPKELTENIDWLKVLDEFDPALLEQKHLDECARRNSYETCYGWSPPHIPVAERLESATFCFYLSRQALINCVKRMDSEGLSEAVYRKARAALIKCIGAKGAMEYIKREYNDLGEEGRRKQEETYRLWEKQEEERRLLEMDEQCDQEDDIYYEYEYGYENASMHEKIVKIRKSLKGSNGKPLTQREFAKLLGYPFYKYAKAEQINIFAPDSEVEEELLDKLVMIAHANPYWLFDSDCDASDAIEDPSDKSVLSGDAPCVFAPVDVILRWKMEGSPKETQWQ